VRFATETAGRAANTQNVIVSKKKTATQNLRMGSRATPPLRIHAMKKRGSVLNVIRVEGRMSFGSGLSTLPPKPRHPAPELSSLKFSCGPCARLSSYFRSDMAGFFQSPPQSRGKEKSTPPRKSTRRWVEFVVGHSVD